MTKLNQRVLEEVNEVIKRLNMLRRWTSLESQGRYNELSKQTLNCITAYILACYYEEAGHTIIWSRFGKIALYRAFQKIYLYFDTPEHIMEAVCKIGKIPEDALTNGTKQVITDKTDEAFANFLCEGIGTDEMKIYRAATKIATLVELFEINSTSNPEYHNKIHELYDSLEEFKDLPGFSEVKDVNGSIFKLLRRICSLRNKNRWAVQSYSVETNVLGHMFDTAIFAYFLAMEQQPEDTEYAGKMFFVGIFHDLAETWTWDIPSPVKEMIPGFRRATELYEQQQLEENCFNVVPNFLAKRLENLMLNAEENQHKLLKGADYLSADSECWRQYNGGTRDIYFIGAIQRRKPGIESGKVLLTECCGELHEYYAICAELAEKIPQHKAEAEIMLQEKRNLSELAKMTPDLKQFVEQKSTIIQSVDEKLLQLENKKAEVVAMMQLVDEKLLQLENKKAEIESMLKQADEK